MPVLVLHFVPISSHVSRPHSPYTSLMCGCYRLARKKEILAETFDVENDVEWSPRYNVAPGQDVVVVRQGAPRPVRTFSLVRWETRPARRIVAAFWGLCRGSFRGRFSNFSVVPRPTGSN